MDLIGAGFWAAADGDQSVDLDGVVAGAVSQTFATKPGTTYTVTYSLAGNVHAGPTTKTGEVLVNGQDVQDFSFDTTGRTYLDQRAPGGQATSDGGRGRYPDLQRTGDSKPWPCLTECPRSG